MPKAIPISKRQLREVLETYGGNRRAVARALGISVRTLSRRLHEEPRLRLIDEEAPLPAWAEEMLVLEQAVINCALDSSCMFEGYVHVPTPNQPYRWLNAGGILRRFAQIAREVTRGTY